MKPTSLFFPAPLGRTTAVLFTAALSAVLSAVLFTFTCLLCFHCVGCAASKGTTRTDEPSEPRMGSRVEPAAPPLKLDARWHKPHDPVEIMSIMTKSRVKYHLVTADPNRIGEGTSLNRIPDAATVIHPGMRVARKRDGRRSLQREQVGARAAALMTQAKEKLAKREHAAALGLYRQALRAQPGSSLILTGIGSILYVTGRYDEAIDALQKAAAANPVGYLARWILADALLAKGRKAEALKAMTQAFVLNRNDSKLRLALEGHLKANGLRLRSGRLTFPFRLKQIQPNRILLIYERNAGIYYLPIFTCMAVWRMEPRFVRLHRSMVKENGFNGLMWSECLRNEWIMIGSHIKQGKDVPDKARWVWSVVDAGYMKEMVLWEMGVPRWPSSILLAADELRRRVGEYIMRFVYVEAKASKEKALE